MLLTLSNCSYPKHSYWESQLRTGSALGFLAEKRCQNCSSLSLNMYENKFSKKKKKNLKNTKN